MHVAVFIIGQAAARVGGLHVLERDGYGLALPGRRRSLGVRTREGDLARELERGERRAGVPGGERADRPHDLVRRGEPPVEALRRGERAAHEDGDVRIGERLELDHAGTRQQRRVHLEVRVLRGGAHHDDGAVLDRMEQGVLLGAVEAVDLVDEEDRAPVVGHEAAARVLDDGAQVLHRAGHGGDLDELAARVRRDDVREGRLAGSGRAVEDHAREHVVLDGRAQPRPLAHRLLLADVLIERGRAHAHGERRVPQRSFGLFL